MSRRTLARVYEEPSTNPGKVIRFVKADSPAELGLAAFTICQAIVQMRDTFGPEMVDAAQALLDVIAGDTPRPPVAVIRTGPAGGSSEPGGDR